MELTADDRTLIIKYNWLPAMLNLQAVLGQSEADALANRYHPKRIAYETSIETCREENDGKDPTGVMEVMLPFAIVRESLSVRHEAIEGYPGCFMVRVNAVKAQKGFVPLKMELRAAV